MTDSSEAGGREKYRRLIAAAQNQASIKCAVAHPCDDVRRRPHPDRPADSRALCDWRPALVWRSRLRSTLTNPFVPFRRQPRCARTGSILSPASPQSTASTRNGSSTRKPTSAAGATPARPARRSPPSATNWTDNISTALGYRVLYTYDQQDTSGRREQSFRFLQWMYGPYVSFRYRFWRARRGLESNIESLQILAATDEEGARLPS